MITGPWDIPAIKDSVPNITITAIPKINDKVPKPYSGIKLLWITKLVENDKNRLYASLLFAMWFTLNDNTIETMVDEAGFIPVKTSVVKHISQNIEDYPIVAGFLKSVSNSVPMPKSPKMATVWGPVSNAINAILTKYSEEGPESALEAVKPTLDQAQQEILEKISG